MPASSRRFALTINWPVIGAVVILVAMGIQSIFVYAPDDGKKQAGFAIVGVGVMFLAMRVNYQILGRWVWMIYILSLLAVLYTILPGMPRGDVLGVSEVHGARLWINLGPVKLQPAEGVKIAFVLAMARYLRFRSNYRKWSGLLLPFLLAIAPLILILKQPDLGTGLIFFPVLFAMLYVAGAKTSHLLIVIGMCIVIAPLLWFSGNEDLPFFRHTPNLIKKYQRDRVYAIFSTDPSILRKTGYQQEKALIAIGSGGILGKGVGNIPVGKTVPEGHNDMVLSLVGEQFGFVGLSGVLLVYLIFFIAGIEIAGSTKEPFGQLVAAGIISQIAAQAFLNIMVNLRLLPVTGVTLPFISYGGSSLLASFIATGLLLNIGQNTPLVMGRKTFDE